MTKKGSWNVALARKEEKIIGAWPYFLTKKYGLNYCTQPHLTPYLGPIIISDDQSLKTATKLGRDKKILNQLVDQLPKTILFVSQGLPSWGNWQPLSWRGFKQTTKYTSRLNLKKSSEELKEALSDKNRNQLFAAEGKIEVVQNNDSNLIYTLSEKSFSRQGQKVPYDRSFFNSFHDSLEQNDSTVSFVALVDGQPVAAAYISLDMDTAYLVSTGRGDDAPAGSVALLIWNCILESKKRNKKIFDFEGSMIQNIESFFRSFGGVQTPYHKVYKTRGKWTRIILDALNRI